MKIRAPDYADLELVVDTDCHQMPDGQSSRATAERLFSEGRAG
ncbi:MAG: hypothetical protein R3C28_13080 [Pirellulaceae bacterium]